MSIDLEKLTPEPWTHGVCGNCNLIHFDGDDVHGVGIIHNPEDLEWVVKANVAWWVMMRRGWNPSRMENGRWYVMFKEPYTSLFHLFTKDTGNDFPDPFTALAEAEKWHVANKEVEEVGK